MTSFHNNEYNSKHYGNTNPMFGIHKNFNDVKIKQFFLENTNKKTRVLIEPSIGFDLYLKRFKKSIFFALRFFLAL